VSTPPKPVAISPPNRTRCATCLHPWAAKWIEDTFTATHAAGHPRPSVPVLHTAMMDYWRENRDKYGLSEPPPLGQVTGHTTQRHHPKGWFLWD